jgi:hypothetical protein|tara:strand:+ start:5591 stop:6346 length:756 start_codon:yes stop_codon:yes gene_type:complete
VEFEISREEFINNFEDACKVYEQYGVLKVLGYFNLEQINNVRNELSAIFEKIPDFTNVEFGYAGIRKHNTHESGKSIRIINPKYYKTFSQMTSLVADDGHLDRFLNYFYSPPNRKLMQVFTTHEYKIVEDADIPRNSWLHFDPYPALKYAVMLQETDEENGALFVIPESHDEGKHIRENMLEHKATFNKGFSHRFVDYDESFQSRYTEEDKVFINATPGDLLVLNTDAWHGGGVLKSEERDRMAIYYHNRQ